MCNKSEEIIDNADKTRAKAFPTLFMEKYISRRYIINV